MAQEPVIDVYRTADTRQEANNADAHDRYKLKSLNRVLDVIESLSVACGPVGVTEIAKTVDLTKGATHKILSNLESRGYVRRPYGSRAYMLGIRLWELGVAAIDRLELREAAVPHLEKLTDLTGESTHLAIYDRGEVVYLHKVSAPHAVQAYTRIGGRAPAHCVSTGKALLASLAARDLAAFLDSGLERFTSTTIVDVNKLTEELITIRERGYATNDGEWRSDIAAVATVIHDHSLSPVAAISVSGPTYRFPMEAALKSVEDLMLAAEQISSSLGYLPSRSTSEE